LRISPNQPLGPFPWEACFQREKPRRQGTFNLCWHRVEKGGIPIVLDKEIKEMEKNRTNYFTGDRDLARVHR
jgi:hypothetical protein